MEDRTTSSDEEAPADLAIGSFSTHPPWVVDLPRLSWAREIDALRRLTSAEVPRMVRRRRLPPAHRALAVMGRLSQALAVWYALDFLPSRIHLRSSSPFFRSSSPSSYTGGALSRRLRVAFQHLGPTYIKLGQILSSGEGIFPEEVVGQFRLLRDRVPPEDLADVRRVIEEDFGQPLEALFSSFSHTPVAAASIAQVHNATLRTGEEVVVKVQRPTVAELVHRDLAVMSWLAPLLVGRIPVSALANPPALVELFAETIVEELDFRLEAQNMLDIARVHADLDRRAIVVPRPHPRLVTRRVLVMERLNGFPWDDVASMRAAGIDTAAVLTAGFAAFMEGAMLYGVFHGDLHGGNLMVQPDGKVALLDYGITGRLEQPKRIAFLRWVVGATTNDLHSQIAAMRDLGALPTDVDIDAMISDLDLDGPVMDPTEMEASEIAAEIRRIIQALLAYGARMPKELMLFAKDMMFLDGSLATMAPDIDIIAEIGKFAQDVAAKWGERIATEIGADFGDAATRPIDLDGIRASFGLAPDDEGLSYRDLQKRRDVIRKRMAKARGRGASRT